MDEALKKLSENLQIWFDDELEIKNVITDTKRKTTNLHRLTELYIKNRGNLEVNGWGIIDSADFNNPYGVYGLSLGEAMELIAFSNTIYGYALALGVHDNTKWFEENLWNKVKKIHQEDLIKAKENQQQTIKKIAEDTGKTVSDIEKSLSDRQGEPDRKDLKI